MAAKPASVEDKSLTFSDTSPESSAGLVSRALFLWVIPFVRIAFQAVKKQEFNASLLPPIPADQQPEHNIKRLREMWEAEIQKKGDKASLSTTIGWFMSRRLAFCAGAMVLQASMMMTMPVLLRSIIRSSQGLEKPVIGYAMAVIIALVSAVAAVIQQLSWHMCCRCAMQVWLALSGLIFEKPAKLSSGNRSNITEGELISMMSQDAQQILQFMSFFSLLVSAPVFILIPSLILPFQLGWACIPAFVIIMTTSTLVERISNVQKTLYFKKMKAADNRNSRLNESFQGIRTVKLNAWESVMAERIQKERTSEIVVLRKIHYLTGLSQAISFGLPISAIVVTFVLYAYDDGDMDAAKIFMCAGLFAFLMQGAQFMPHGFTMVRMMRASMKRIEKLLIKTEDFANIDDTSLPSGTARCVEASFRWSLPEPGKDEVPPTLRKISLDAAPGEMIAVCGRVGAGKTTLTGGLLGLVTRTSGTVSVSGSIAYVSQIPQIMNETIRENILFGTEMDEDWYKQVLQACCLKDDLKQFGSGDETEIGERGITISGGQKQRIAIARAAYSRADVIVFDDPLSAMDAHVGRLVFDKCFRELLNGRTIIFCTNQLQFCEHCARVYMLIDGEIVESGSYPELSSASPPGPFGVFLQSVVGKENEELDSQADTKEPSEDAAISPEAVQPGGAPTLPKEALQNTEGAKDAKDSTPKSQQSKESTPKCGKEEGKMIIKEKKIEGGIGLHDWMQIARAANARCLGGGLILTSAMCPVFMYGVNFMLSRWTDSLLNDDNKPTGEDAFSDTGPIFGYVASAILFVMCLFATTIFGAMYFLKCSRVLHHSMVVTTLQQRMTWFDTTPVGRILNRFGNDVMQLDMMMPRLFNMWAMMFFGVIVMIILAGIFAPPACLLSFALIGVVMLLKKYYVPIALDTQRVQLMALSPLLGAQSGFLGAMDSIRCFRRVDIFVDRFYAQQGDFIKAYYWNFVLDRMVQTFFTTGASSVFFGCVAALLLTFALYDTPFSGLATPGTTGVVLSQLCQLSQQAPMMIFMTTRLEQAMAAVQRIVEFKDTPTEDSHQAQTLAVPSSWPQQGALKLEGVDMRYQDHLPLALKGINLDIRPGEKVGIVGRTGSGKSSIIMTCFRMIECAGGKIELDGQDLSQSPLSEVRGRLGVIPQDSWLFSGTIRSNLDVWGKKTDDQLWAVLRHAQLETQIRGLDGGLNHEVKEKGENLSAGTAQLLCLARVLLKEPKVLFMDEATASVDTETDNLVQETIRKEGVLPKSCSIVTVAHRLATVIDYDRIIVLAEGKIVEQGPPDKLLDDEESHLSKLVQHTGAAAAKELKRRSMVAGTARQAAVEEKLEEPEETSI